MYGYTQDLLLLAFIRTSKSVLSDFSQMENFKPTQLLFNILAVKRTGIADEVSQRGTASVEGELED